MDEKASLLEQLRIDRGEERQADTSDAIGLARRVRRWRLAACCCAALALAAAGIAAWQFLEPVPASAAAALTAADPASNGQDSAVASGAAPASDSGSVAAARGVPGSQSDTVGSTGALASVLDASGYIIARRQATVSAKTIGRLTEVLVEEGDRVTAGQVVARLDDSNTLAALNEARAQLDLAEAELEAAKTALADAQPIFKRNQEQYASRVISAQDFDVAEASFHAAESNYATKQSAVKVARTAVAAAKQLNDDMIVRAPFSGMVTEKAAQPGEIVAPTTGGGGFTKTGICTIVDMDSLEADVDVSENYIERVHPGQPAVVRLDAYPDWNIPAHVVAIIPTADRSKATVKVRVGFKVKDPRILPEMGARVSFLKQE